MSGIEAQRGPQSVGPPPKRHVKYLNHALPWIGLAVSAAFAYLAVRNVNFHDVWRGLRTSNYWWLLPALLMLAVTVVLRAIRWRFIFEKESRPPFGAVLISLLTGYFFNSVLPARAGEAVGIVVLKRRAGTSMAESAATVVIQRIYDVACLLILLFIAAPWLPRVTWLHAAVVLAALLFAGIVTAVVVLAVYGARPLRFVLRPLARLPFFDDDRLDDIAESLARGLASFRRPRLALGALFWTTLGWLTLALSTWFVMVGFGFDISYTGGLLVVIATNLAMILPSSPSAIGVFEAAVIVALRPYGVSDSDGLSYGLVLHALNFVPFLLIGLVLVGTIAPWGARRKRLELVDEA